MTDDAVIELSGVTRTFGVGDAAVTAVREVDLAVHPGEHVAITGASGSGKSTLLNVLGLLDRPSGGEYLVDGIATSQMPDRRLARLRARTIGFVFQAFHLIPYKTATENVCLGLMYAGVSRGRRRGMAREALSRVGLAHRLDADPTTMSGGERQRVAIARAVAASPRLLLCDEPTGNLDSATAAEVSALLRDLNAQGLTIIVVTHDQSIAADAARQLLMRDGRLERARSSPVVSS